MAARAIGSGVISVAMVTVPVKLFSAVVTKNPVAFNMLHKACGSRVKQQLICPVENVVIEHEDTVKGFEYAPDQFVRFTPEELKTIESARSGEIEIVRCVSAEDIPPHVPAASFFLGPDKGGDRSYELLARSLVERRRVAVGRYTKRGRDKLVFIRPYDGGLMLQEGHFPDEVRSFSGVERATVALTSIELQLGGQLVDAFAGAFDHAAVRDGYSERLRAAVEQKVAGRDVVVTPTPETKPVTMNLLDALDASVRQARAHANDAPSTVDVPVRSRKGPKKATPRAPASKRKKGGDASA